MDSKWRGNLNGTIKSKKRAVPSFCRCYSNPPPPTFGDRSKRSTFRLSSWNVYRKKEIGRVRLKVKERNALLPSASHLSQRNRGDTLFLLISFLSGDSVPRLTRKKKIRISYLFAYVKAVANEISQRLDLTLTWHTCFGHCNLAH